MLGFTDIMCAKYFQDSKPIYKCNRFSLDNVNVNARAFQTGVVLSSISKMQ